MRRLRYCVAMSLDGFIAGPKGEYDWIVPDAGVDFAAVWAQFDTALMGRRTYEIARTRRLDAASQGVKWVVVSGSLLPGEDANVTVIGSGIEQAVAALKAEPGKDIWLFGGGVLFRFLLDLGLVDTIEVAVLPVLLGSGVPLLPEGRRQQLHLDDSKALPSGRLMLTYSVVGDAPAG